MKRQGMTMGLLVLWACASSGAERPAPFVQPAAAPGAWEPAAQPLPPIGRIVAAPATRRPVYGIYCWASSYTAQHDFLREVGWPNVRIGGPMDDASMKLIVADPVEVMVTLGPRLHQSFSGKARDWRNRATYDSDEAFVEDYLKGVELFLTRWGPGGTFFKDHPELPERPIRHVEIWNEPNLWYLDSEKSDGGLSPQEREAVEAKRAAIYAKLLPAAYARIKKTWPDVQVVGFAAANLGDLHLRFIRMVHERNPAVARSYDILSCHPYTKGAPPEGDTVRTWGRYSIARSLEGVRKLMADNGAADRPVWYTEQGWAISPEEGGHYPRDAAGEGFTPAILQAAYWVRNYAWCLRLGVERLTPMAVVDTDTFNAGLLNRDGARRPAALAVREMIRRMPHPKLTAAESDGAGGVFAYWILADAPKGEAGGRVLMAWKTDGPGELDIAWPHPNARATDMLGNEKTVDAPGGRLRIGIGPCPVYLAAPAP